jgi:hypothetical protein
MLKSLNSSENCSFSFSYFGNSGLVSSKTDHILEKSTHFVYEKNGKIKEVIEPNGIVTNISYFINGSGIVSVIIKKIHSYSYKETWITNATSICIFKSKIYIKNFFFSNLIL